MDRHLRVPAPVNLNWKMNMQSDAEVLEQKVSAVRGRARQDKKNPLLISMSDALLWPNVPNLRKSKDMILYTGNPKAGPEERRRYVESMKTGRLGMRSVIDTSQAFDVGTATVQDLIDFALTEYGKTLNPAAPLVTLRKQIVLLAKEANALIQASSLKQETADIS